LFGTSYGDPSPVAGRPQYGAIFQYDPHLGSSGGSLLASGFAVIQDFNAGGLFGFDGSLGGVGAIRFESESTTYLVGGANNAGYFGIYSFPYSTSPSARSFVTSSIAASLNMSPPVRDPVAPDGADFPGFEGLSSTIGDTFAIQGCGGGRCRGYMHYTYARTGTQADFGTSYPGGAAEAHSIGIVAPANIGAFHSFTSDYLWIAGNALVWAREDAFSNSGPTPPEVSSSSVVIAHVFSTSLPGGPGDDGSWPMGGLVVDPNHNSLWTNAIFYGTTEFGGANGTGTVYCVIPSDDETTFTYEKLASFGAAASGAPTHPRGELVAVADGTGGTWLYGSSVDGGAGNTGAVFELKAGACSSSVAAPGFFSPPHMPPRLSPAAEKALGNPLLYVGAAKTFKAAGFPVTGNGP
jgi:hypothetical protein